MVGFSNISRPDISHSPFQSYAIRNLPHYTKQNGPRQSPRLQPNHPPGTLRPLDRLGIESPNTDRSQQASTTPSTHSVPSHSSTKPSWRSSKIVFGKSTVTENGRLALWTRICSVSPWGFWRLGNEKYHVLMAMCHVVYIYSWRKLIMLEIVEGVYPASRFGWVCALSFNAQRQHCEEISVCRLWKGRLSHHSWGSNRGPNNLQVDVDCLQR